MEGKVGRCPVAWKNCVAARDHETTGTHGTVKPSGRVQIRIFETLVKYKKKKRML